MVPYIMRIAVVVLYATACLSRGIAVHQNYSAPIPVYRQLTDLTADMQASHGDSLLLCVGKEWYRYPSSFFLPDR